MIAPSSRLLLRADVRVAQGESPATLRLMTREDEYTLTGGGVEALRSVLPYLNGARSIAVLATGADLSTPTLAQLLEPLIGDDLVLDMDAATYASATDAFMKELRRECRFWSAGLLVQPFWETLLCGRASLGMLHGWGIEFRHFADAANEYMAAGVAFCRDGGAARERLSQHFIEESTHGEIFLQGLTDCGLSRRAVLDAMPLATTRALINYLWEVAAEGTSAYSATFMLMQATEPSRPAADDFLRHLSRLYPAAVGLFNAFHRHTLLDISLHHHDALFAQSCLERGELSAKERERAVQVVRDLAEHFSAFFEGIRSYYVDDVAITTRRRRSSAFLEARHARG